MQTYLASPPPFGRTKSATRGRATASVVGPRNFHPSPGSLKGCTPPPPGKLPESKSEAPLQTIPALPAAAWLEPRAQCQETAEDLGQLAQALRLGRAKGRGSHNEQIQLCLGAFVPSALQQGCPVPLPVCRGRPGGPGGRDTGRAESLRCPGGVDITGRCFLPQNLPLAGAFQNHISTSWENLFSW